MSLGGGEPNNATRQHRQHHTMLAHFYSFHATLALKIDFSAGVRLPFRHHHYRVLFKLNERHCSLVQRSKILCQVGYSILLV